jgi:aryl-alcohol dehydrogenase-like predicted oxidoreductase
MRLDPMRYVVIPNTDLRVSQVCLGSTDFGSVIPAPDAFALLDEFVALGGNFVDTAHVYANWLPGPRSISEKTIGQWLRARGVRDQIVVGTKGAHPDMATMHVSRLSRAEIVQDLSESLDHLQTDTIDLYWLHRDDPAIPVGEIVDILNEQIEAGKIRYVGVSNWSIPRIQAALDYAQRSGKQAFVANQPMWSLAAPNMAKHPDKTIIAMDQDGIDFHRRTGMAVLAYSSQAHGFFSKLDAKGWDGVPKGDLTLFDNATNWKRLERIRELTQRYGVAINDVVLAYLLCQPFPTIPIIGSKRIEQLRSSLKAFEVPLTPDDVAYLEVSG